MKTPPNVRAVAQEQMHANDRQTHAHVTQVNTHLIHKHEHTWICHDASECVNQVDWRVMPHGGILRYIRHPSSPGCGGAQPANLSVHTFKYQHVPLSCTLPQWGSECTSEMYPNAKTINLRIKKGEITQRQGA